MNSFSITAIETRNRCFLIKKTLTIFNLASATNKKRDTPAPFFVGVLIKNKQKVSNHKYFYFISPEVNAFILSVLNHLKHPKLGNILRIGR